MPECRRQAPSQWGDSGRSPSHRGPESGLHRPSHHRRPLASEHGRSSHPADRGLRGMRGARHHLDWRNSSGVTPACLRMARKVRSGRSPGWFGNRDAPVHHGKAVGEHFRRVLSADGPSVEPPCTRGQGCVSSRHAGPEDRDPDADGLGGTCLRGGSQATLRQRDAAGKLRARRHPMNDYRLYREGDVERWNRQIEKGASE